MLDVVLSPTLPQVTWQSLDQKAILPCTPEEFFENGLPFVANSRRSHSRIHFRGRASMRREGSTSGVYTIDLSPKGLGLYSPVQLLPKQRIEIYFEQCQLMELVVHRCRRIDDYCYLIGTSFRRGPMSPIAYRDLIRQLQS